MNNTGVFLTIEGWTRDEIDKRLVYFDGNKSKVAMSLGLSRASIFRKIKQYRDNDKFTVTATINEATP